LARASEKKTVVPGEFVVAKPDLLIFHDLNAYGRLVSPYYSWRQMHLGKIPDPDRILIIFDHCVPAADVNHAAQQKAVREFAKEQNIRNLYDVGRNGIGHHVIVEKGYARPGMLLAIHDTHGTTAGAVGALATPLGLDMLRILSTGKNWYRVPESLKFKITGEFQKGVMSRDLGQLILHDMSPDRGVYKVMEFTGPTAKRMSMDSRMTLCNMTIEAGAKAGIFNPDQITIDYVKARTTEPFEAVPSDPGAEYEEIFDYEVTKLEPQLAAHPNTTNTRAVAEVAGIEIDQAFIGSCASGRMEDLRIAAKILKGNKIHPNVRLIISPVSQETYLKAVTEGLMESFVRADALIGPPTCGPCLGMHMGVIASGETCISTSTRCEIGRMGSPESRVYLANPATVAASALEGKITDPRPYLKE
jgi:3-isopropylmalate/(R)-2-methylmalate dehydratase large subunit